MFGIDINDNFPFISQVGEICVVQTFIYIHVGENQVAFKKHLQAEFQK